jgi:hypothetical protein
LVRIARAGSSEDDGTGMVARIYQPAKSAMQSGKGRTRTWLLEHEPESAREIDPLMGWTSSGDMRQQLKLSFESKEAAIAYAERNGIPYTVAEPPPVKSQVKAYADNFKYGRIGSWTH